MKLSIIIVTWNNENYIEQAIESCGYSNGYDVEIIVVNNNSEDDTGSLAQRVAERKNLNIRIINHPENVGLGLGRNVGLDAAEGDYIVFLDGDDWFAPGAINYLYRLTEEKKSDIILYDYNRAWPTGSFTDNPLKRLLSQEGDYSNPKMREKIIPNMGVAWNKVYKKRFLDENSIRFTERYYEDIDWNYKCIFYAKTYYVTPKVCVHYRQRIGSITKSVSLRHFDIIDQYKDVLSMLQSSEELSNAYARKVYNYAKGQMLHVAKTRSRLPKSSESQYLRKVSKLLDEWRTSIIPTKKRELHLKVATLGFAPLYFYYMKHIGKYDALFANRLEGLKKKTAQFLYKHIFLRLPIKKNVAIFESYWGRKIDCNPYAIANYLSKNKKSKVIYSVNEELLGQNENYNFSLVKRFGIKYYYYLARAKYLTSNVNFAGDTVKRKKAYFVQTFHGTPIKRMGINVRKIRPKDVNWRSFYHKFKKWDIAISSNQYSSRIWRMSHPGEYKIYETGYPRNDILFDPNNTQLVRQKLKIDKAKKIALYAPTFRDDSVKKPIPEDILDFTAISKSLGEDWVLLVRMHHLSKIKSKLPKNCIDVGDYASVSEILAATDLLITDYSSIMFDFACTKRPIILYTYDYSKYSKSRGTYIDIRKELPSLVANNLSELCKKIYKKDFLSQKAIAEVNAFSNKYCPWDDGHASQRVVESIYK